jgi:hypothetical protein
VMATVSLMKASTVRETAEASIDLTTLVHEPR